MRKELLRGLTFRLEVNGVTVAGFSEAALGASRLPVRRKPSEGPRRAAKLLQSRNADSIVLTRGLTDSAELTGWLRSAAGETAGRTKSVVLVVTDEQGADVARYAVKNALPVKYQGADLNSAGNEVAIESLELSHEGIESAD
jgi:phage tail-like protein